MPREEMKAWLERQVGQELQVFPLPTAENTGAILNTAATFAKIACFILEELAQVMLYNSPRVGDKDAKRIERIGRGLMEKYGLVSSQALAASQAGSDTSAAPLPPRRRKRSTPKRAKVRPRKGKKRARSRR